MLADHTDTFTTNSGAPRKALYRDALHPSPKGTMRLACNVKYMHVGQPRPPLRPQERPSHPSPSASGRVPLLETPSFQPRFDCPPSQHLREGGGRSQQYRNGPAVLTTRGPFPPPPLLQQRPADTESSIPQRRLGDAPLHHQPHRYSRGTPRHRDVGTAPPPFSGWYGVHRHHSPQVGRATAAVQLWSSPATWTSVYIRAHSPPFLQHTASQHRPAPPSHQLLGGCSGGALCVTQACSVCPAVCCNGSLFLYTPDWCVLVA